MSVITIDRFDEMKRKNNEERQYSIHGWNTVVNDTCLEEVRDERSSIVWIDDIIVHS